MTNHAPPTGLIPQREGDNFHYWHTKDVDGEDERGGLVIFPSSQDGIVTLDGEFTPEQLRAIADWIESVNLKVYIGRK
jgi:hypothetical protein